MRPWVYLMYQLWKNHLLNGTGQPIGEWVGMSREQLEEKVKQPRNKEKYEQLVREATEENNRKTPKEDSSHQPPAPHNLPHGQQTQPTGQNEPPDIQSWLNQTPSLF